MFLDPDALNQQLVDELQALATYLQDEVDERVCAPQELSAHTRQCKETLLTINVLVPKLRALRLNVATARSRPVCVNCD